MKKVYKDIKRGKVIDCDLNYKRFSVFADNAEQFYFQSEGIAVDYIAFVCFSERDNGDWTVQVQIKDDNIVESINDWFVEMSDRLMTSIKFVNSIPIGETFSLGEDIPFAGKTTAVFMRHKLIEPVHNVCGEYRVIKHLYEEETAEENQ